ncbi:MAG: hypothetical protein JW837_01450, partial [Sedimentisphaerales bacterium]|nr:hypothetical protein [Sedimentisphaerales bacterium]
YPKNMLVKGKKSLLTVKWICPIHAEPIQNGACPAIYACPVRVPLTLMGSSLCRGGSGTAHL